MSYVVVDANNPSHEGAGLESAQRVNAPHFSAATGHTFPIARSAYCTTMADRVEIQQLRRDRLDRPRSSPQFHNGATQSGGRRWGALSRPFAAAPARHFGYLEVLPHPS